jgi:hypothetical protein
LGFLPESLPTSSLSWRTAKTPRLDLPFCQQHQGWGARVIDRLAADLRRTYPGMTGLSPRNLKYVRALAQAWADEAIVQAGLAQITWYHNIALLEKLSAQPRRLWYAHAAIEHGWSRNVLVHWIESDLACRVATADPARESAEPERAGGGVEQRRKPGGGMVDKELAARLAKALAVTCVRNTFLEHLHAGISPSSQAGDHSDVTVVTPYGEIPWKNVSRISDEEMKLLMKEVVNKIFTVLIHLGDEKFMSPLLHWGAQESARWDEPELLTGFILPE